MSNLIAVAYDDKDTAVKVLETLGRLQVERTIELEDAVIVEREEKSGKVKLHQGRSLTGAGAATGAIWGGLIGLLFLAPLIGMAVGAARGAAAGAVSDIGVDDRFMKDLGERLEKGGAAVIVLVRRSTPDKVIPEIAGFGGTVLQTSLSNEREAELQAALDARATTA